MTAVWYRFRAELRHRWQAWLGLGIVVGLIGGAVVSLFAGADRTQNAFDRYLQGTNGADAYLVTGVEGADFGLAVIDLDELERHPAITDAAQYVSGAAYSVAPDGAVLGPEAVNYILPLDRQMGGTVSRAVPIEGRLADPDDPGEATVAFSVADDFGFRVGDRLPVHFTRFDEAEAVFSAQIDPSEVAVSEPLTNVEIVGIVAVPPAFNATGGNEQISDIQFTPALTAELTDVIGLPSIAFSTDDVDGLDDVLEAAAAQDDGDVFVARQSSLNPTAQRQFDFVGRALRIAGAVLALVAVAAIAQALARQGRSEAGADRSLAALGMGSRSLGVLRLLKAGAVLLPALPVVVITAVLLSPLYPIGGPRNADPNPGFQLTGLMLIGAAIAGLVVLACVGATSVRRSRVAARPLSVPKTIHSPDTGRIAHMIGRFVRRPVAVAGARFAFSSGSGTDSVPVRSSGLMVTIGVGAVIVGVVFSASLSRTQQTPALYGWTYDYLLGSDFTPPQDDTGIDLLARDDDIARLAVGNDLDLRVEDETLTTFGLRPVVGRLDPALVQGRAPSGRGDLLLDVDTLNHLALGDVVTARLDGTTADFEIVGRAVLPDVQAYATFDGLRRLDDDLEPQESIVTLVPGADAEDFLDRNLKQIGLTRSETFSPRQPSGLGNAGQIQTAPLLLAGLLAIVATLSVAHLLLTALRRRRHDVAVLKALGFTRFQTMATIVWQSVLIVLVALLVAVPVGALFGRWLWRVFAEQIAVVPSIDMPLGTLILVPLVALGLAVLVAVIPALRAAGTDAAAVLREE